jgi:hypothetical protein
MKDFPIHDQSCDNDQSSVENYGQKGANLKLKDNFEVDANSEIFD